jgi:methionine-rich copper-binding protein CopC
MGNLGQRLGWIVLAVLVTLGPVRQASGDEEHAKLVKSVPVNHEVLLQPPPVIQSWFSEVLAAKGSVMRLYDAGNTILAVGGLDARDRSHQSMKIVAPYLNGGVYHVGWHAIDADDNTATEGSFDFKIQGASRAPFESAFGYLFSRGSVATRFRPPAISPSSKGVRIYSQTSHATCFAGRCLPS